jgi:vancomycin resistance protein VanW
VDVLFRGKVAYHRARRHLSWWLDPQPWATDRGEPRDFPVVVASRSSPLRRAPDGAIAAYTTEKTNNLGLAAAKVSRLVISPGEMFSFCRTVGKTTRKGGYLPALELTRGKLCPEIGGGLCQLSNLLLLLSLDINAEIVERHRHSYDLFRDVERTVPFGCGATVFYNYVDFQFRSTLATPILLHVAAGGGVLRADVRSTAPLPFSVRIFETDHRFFRRDGDIYRANRVWREVRWDDGRDSPPELLFANECKVLYPADDLLDEDSQVQTESSVQGGGGA